VVHRLSTSHENYVPHGVYALSDAVSTWDLLLLQEDLKGNGEFSYLHATENTVWILFRLNAAHKYLCVGPLIELIDLAESARGRVDFDRRVIITALPQLRRL